MPHAAAARRRQALAADCLADVVEDGEELQPVFDRGGTSTPAASVVAVGRGGRMSAAARARTAVRKGVRLTLRQHSLRRRRLLTAAAVRSTSCEYRSPPDPDEDPAARGFCARFSSALAGTATFCSSWRGVWISLRTWVSPRLYVWAQAKSEGATAPRLQRWARIFRRGFVEPVKADVWLRTSQGSL